MTTEKIKRMLDACYQAKRIRELLPPLHRELPRLTFSIWITFMHWKTGNPDKDIGYQ